MCVSSGQKKSSGNNEVPGLQGSEERKLELVTKPQADHRFEACYKINKIEWYQGQTPTGHTTDEIWRDKGFSGVLDELKAN